MTVREASIRAATIGAILGVWELYAWFAASPRLFPPLEHIATNSFPLLGNFREPPQTGYLGATVVLLANSAVTIVRIFVGLAIGMPLGVSLGLAMFLLRGEGPASTLALTILRSVPLLALIPLFSYAFGGSETTILAYLVFAVLVTTASDTYEAAANLRPQLAEQARLLGARRRSFVLRAVYLPGITPQLKATLRNVIGVSWAFSLAAEYINVLSGLGYLAYNSYLYSDMGALAIVAVVYVGLAQGGYALYIRFVK